MKVVRSTSNPGVKETLRLRNRRDRRATGLFLVEGFREIRRALDAKVEMQTLWFCPELYLGESEGEIVDRAAVARADTIQVAEAPFRKMAYRDRPEGLLAVCGQFDTSLERIEIGTSPLLLVVEAIEKPGNLGTMIRTATAAHADAVIVTDPTTDVFNPNVVRASIGTVFAMPIAVCRAGDAIAWLHEHGIAISASTPDAAIAHWDAPFGDRAAIVVGAEQYGLSETWLAAAETKVRIPMPGDAIDSLNAAAAAAVLLYEALRQRSL
ncbi:MAG: TrmH family RNA methyltransferase [Actinomycetota bacterium]